MLRIALFFVLQLGALLGFSQIEKGTRLLNGHHSFDFLFDSDNSEKWNEHTYRINLKTNWGYFFRPNTMVGLGVDFSYQIIDYQFQKDSDIDIITKMPIFARHYFNPGKVNTFASLLSNFQWTDARSFKNNYDGFFINFWLGAGINFFLFENVAIETALSYRFAGRNIDLYLDYPNDGSKLNLDFGIQFFLDMEKTYECFNCLEISKLYFKKGTYQLGGRFALDLIKSNEIIHTIGEPTFSLFLNNRWKIGGGLLIEKRKYDEDYEPIRRRSAAKAFVQYFIPISQNFYFSTSLFAQHQTLSTDYHRFRAFNTGKRITLNLKEHELMIGGAWDIHFFFYSENLIKTGIQFFYHTPYGTVLEPHPVPMSLHGTGFRSQIFFAWQYFIMRNLAVEFSTQFEYLDTFSRIKEEAGTTFSTLDYRDHEKRLNLNIGLYFFIFKKS